MRNSCFIQDRVPSSWECKTFSMDSKQKYKRTCYLSFTKGTYEMDSNRKSVSNRKSAQKHLNEGPDPLFLHASICGAVFLVFWQQLQLYGSSAVLSANMELLLFPSQLKNPCITAYPSHSSKSREKYAFTTWSI